MKNGQSMTLQIFSRGPVQALKDLDAGKVEVAVGGLNFADWMELMEKEGYPVADKNNYMFKLIGQDKITVLMHKDLTIPRLSKQQLADIFTGGVQNWSEVGGPDLPIVVILGTKTPGIQYLFQKRIMDGAEYRKDVVMGTNAFDLKNRVLTTPGSICLGASSQVDSLTHTPLIPDIIRPITMITRVFPQDATHTIYNYITKDDSIIVH